MKNAEQRPRYVRLCDVLRHEILIGKYSDRFPSANMLVRRFNISRPTVMRALLDLKREGLLIGRSGSGTYVSASAKSAQGFLGMIIPDRGWNRFFAALSEHIENYAHQTGYTVLKDRHIASSDDFRASQMIELAHEFVEKRVKGVLLEPFDHYEKSDKTTRTILSMLTEAHIPVVLLDRDIVPYPRRSEYDLVGIDNVRAGFIAAEHLISKGAKHIVFQSLPLSSDATIERSIGCGQAVIAHGGKWSKTRTIEFDPSNLKEVKRHYCASNRPDGVVCRNDHVAAILIQSLNTLGIKVPKDIKVVGFDDCQLAEILSPPLTSMRQPADAIATTAFRMLLSRIADPGRESCTCRHDAILIPRRSTAK